MKMIEKLLDRVNEALIERRDYDDEEDDICSVTLHLGRKELFASVSEKYGNVCELTDLKFLDLFYPNIEEYLYQHIISFSDIERRPEETEWERHGFRDEKDFVNYKYK